MEEWNYKETLSEFPSVNISHGLRTHIWLDASLALYLGK